MQVYLGQEMHYGHMERRMRMMGVRMHAVGDGRETPRKTKGLRTPLLSRFRRSCDATRCSVHGRRLSIRSWMVDSSTARPLHALEGSDQRILVIRSAFIPSLILC